MNAGKFGSLVESLSLPDGAMEFIKRRADAGCRREVSFVLNRILPWV